MPAINEDSVSTKPLPKLGEVRFNPHDDENVVIARPGGQYCEIFGVHDREASEFELIPYDKVSTYTVTSDMPIVMSRKEHQDEFVYVPGEHYVTGAKRSPKKGDLCFSGPWRDDDTTDEDVARAEAEVMEGSCPDDIYFFPALVMAISGDVVFYISVEEQYRHPVFDEDDFMEPETVREMSDLCSLKWEAMMIWHFELTHPLLAPKHHRLGTAYREVEKKAIAAGKPWRARYPQDEMIDDLRKSGCWPA